MRGGEGVGKREGDKGGGRERREAWHAHAAPQRDTGDSRRWKITHAEVVLVRVTPEVRVIRLNQNGLDEPGVPNGGSGGGGVRRKRREEKRGEGERRDMRREQKEREEKRGEEKEREEKEREQKEREEKEREEEEKCAPRGKDLFRVGEPCKENAGDATQLRQEREDADHLQCGGIIERGRGEGDGEGEQRE